MNTLLNEILKTVHSCPQPSLGIDLDGTIDESPVFFSILSHVWPGKVYVITFRNDADGIIEALKKFNIKVTDVVMVATFEQKAKEIDRLGISVFFDDMDECLKNVAPNCTVMKIRNEGNFDYNDKLWVYGDKTGKLI